MSRLLFLNQNNPLLLYLQNIYQLKNSLTSEVKKREKSKPETCYEDSCYYNVFFFSIHYYYIYVESAYLHG